MGFFAGHSLFGYGSPLPYFLGITGLCLLASTPLFQAADSPPTSAANRLRTLDGLRGFLALSVVFHHINLYHEVLLDQFWTAPKSPFYAQLGPFGVSLFFMITGYLFWGRLLRNAGVVNWAALYIGRLFRIGPLYLAAALLVLVAAQSRTGFHLLVPAGVFLAQIGRWLSLGLFLAGGLNGWYWAPMLLAGVTWTLQWEWFFYFSLPLQALFARRHVTRLLFPASLLLLTVLLRSFGVQHVGVVSVLPNVDLFLCGMLCASLHARFGPVPLPDWAASTLMVLAGGAAVHSQSAYSLPQMAALLVVFYLVTGGCTLFGLLVSRPARRLGDISYGIYLLQGLAMTVFFRPARFRAFALVSPLHHWTLGLLSCLLLLGMALAAHVWIELPGMAWGRAVTRRWVPDRTR